MRRPGRSVSRGPGKWQRELLSAVSGVHTATVSGVVRTCVPEPNRNDFTAARRGAKGLAMEGKVTGLYVYACQRCGHVQDHGPERCCGVVRSSLAVTRRGRMLPHLAAPPTGTSCPPLSPGSRGRARPRASGHRSMAWLVARGGSRFPNVRARRRRRAAGPRPPSRPGSRSRW